jgi:uncharacterized protein HemY
MAKFRGPKRMFGGKKFMFLIIALVLLFAIWFFFLKGGREGFTADEWGKMNKDDCAKNKGDWKDEKCKEAVAAAGESVDAATTAVTAAKAALGMK